jgi:hypothetical protein
MEQRKIFADSVTTLPDEGITPLGAVVNTTREIDKTHDMNLIFSLNMDAALQKALEDKVAAGQTVSLAELKQTYVPDPGNVEVLVSWLKTQGYTITRVSPNGTAIYASAPIPTIEQSLPAVMADKYRRPGNDAVSARR